jgi:hypothetical protein
MELMRGMRAQSEELQKSAKDFDGSVTKLLKDDQKSKYEDWKKSESQRLMQERRQQFGGRRGGGGGAGDNR